METAFIELSENACGGECAFVAAGDGGWIADGWKLRIRFPKQHGSSVSVHLEDLGVGVQIENLPV